MMFDYKSKNCSVVSLYDFMCEISDLNSEFPVFEEWGKGLCNIFVQDQQWWCWGRSKVVRPLGGQTFLSRFVLG